MSSILLPTKPVVEANHTVMVPGKACRPRNFHACQALIEDMENSAEMKLLSLAMENAQRGFCLV